MTSMHVRRAMLELYSARRPGGHPSVFGAFFHFYLYSVYIYTYTVYFGLSFFQRWCSVRVASFSRSFEYLYPFDRDKCVQHINEQLEYLLLWAVWFLTLPRKKKKKKSRASCFTQLKLFWESERRNSRLQSIETFQKSSCLFFFARRCPFWNRQLWRGGLND